MAIITHLAGCYAPVKQVPARSGLDDQDRLTRWRDRRIDVTQLADFPSTGMPPGVDEQTRFPLAQQCSLQRE